MAAFDHIIGSVLDGKYEVQRLVARGGMGEVYAGAHLQLERPVAIKVLHGDLSDKEAFVSRFAREARTAARLEHPNAVHIYDFGALEDGSTYLEVTITEYDRRGWGAGGHDLDWYCSGNTEAHIGSEPVYVSNETELVELMGEAAYGELARHCEAHLRSRSALALHPADPH